MTQQLTGSWRKHFDFRFISGEDMTPGKDVTMTIKAVIKEKVHRGDEVTALLFHETEKMMAVNKTNARTISAVVGSPMVEHWIGHKIILQQKKVSAFGGEHLCIRVKMQKVMD